MRISAAYCSALILGSSLLYSAHSVATPATCRENTGQSSNYAAYEPNLVDIRTWIGSTDITIPSTAEPGDVVATLWHPGLPSLENMPEYNAGRYIALANCGPGKRETFKLVGYPTGTWNVYRRSPSDNIGYRVIYPGWPAVPSVTFISGGQGTTTVPKGRDLYLLYPPPGQMKIEFILLSHSWPTSRSVVISGRLAETDVDGWGSDRLLRYSLYTPVVFKPEPCYFTSNKVINLALDPVDSEQFTGAGVSRNAKAIPTMRMQCSGVSARPVISIRGTSDSSGTPGVLKNQSTNSPATGVGILLEHTPPSLQAYPTDLNGGTQTPSLGLVNDGSCGSNCTNWSLPMRASYYSTSPTVTAGSVSARVTVDVTYP